MSESGKMPYWGGRAFGFSTFALKLEQLTREQRLIRIKSKLRSIRRRKFGGLDVMMRNAGAPNKLRLGAAADSEGRLRCSP